MKTILIVEDNDLYFDAAKSTITQNTLDRAIDYCDAMKKITGEKYDGAIIDCFFPEETGTNKTDLGKSLVARLQGEDPHERKMAEGMEILKDHINLEYPEIYKLARYLVDSLPDFKNSVINQALKSVGELSKEVSTLAFRNTVELIYRENRAPKDYYGDLFRAIDNSEANQPLGILVAEKAAELHHPLVLATSTYHHDSLTQPIQNYASTKGWKLIDCAPNKENDKETPEYWVRVMRELERLLSK